MVLLSSFHLLSYCSYNPEMCTWSRVNCTALKRTLIFWVERKKQTPLHKTTQIIHLEWWSTITSAGEVSLDRKVVVKPGHIASPYSMKNKRRQKAKGEGSSERRLSEERTMGDERREKPTGKLHIEWKQNYTTTTTKQKD